MSEAICLTCRFWVPYYALDHPYIADHHGDCRRHAPVIENKNDHYRVRPLWPFVNAQSFCGDHEFRPENAKAPSQNTTP